MIGKGKYRACTCDGDRCGAFLHTCFAILPPALSSSVVAAGKTSGNMYEIATHQKALDEHCKMTKRLVGTPQEEARDGKGKPVKGKAVAVPPLKLIARLYSGAPTIIASRSLVFGLVLSLATLLRDALPSSMGGLRAPAAIAASSAASAALLAPSERAHVMASAGSPLPHIEAIGAGGEAVSMALKGTTVPILALREASVQAATLAAVQRGCAPAMIAAGLLGGAVSGTSDSLLTGLFGGRASSAGSEAFAGMAIKGISVGVRAALLPLLMGFVNSVASGDGLGGGMGRRSRRRTWPRSKKFSKHSVMIVSVSIHKLISSCMDAYACLFIHPSIHLSMHPSMPTHLFLLGPTSSTHARKRGE